MSKLKHLLLIIIVLYFSNCSIVELSKASNNQHIILKTNKIPFELKENRILVGNDVNFMLDIGAPNVIYKSKINNFPVSDSIVMGSLIKNNGQSIKNKIVIIDTLENSFFKGEKILFRLIDNMNNCHNANGILGSELLENSILELNFEKNYIMKIDSLSTDHKNSYQELEVDDFDGFYFYIKIKANNKFFSVKLDTGSPYDILLKKKDYNKFAKNESSENYYFNTKSNLDSLLVSHHQIYINNIPETHLVLTNNYIKRNILGIEYMKNFNWILDYNSGKIFIKQFDKISKKPTLPENKVVIEDNSLVFYQTKNINSINKLGQKIFSVNGEKIDNNNICKYYELLNSNDWNSIKIEWKGL